MMVLSRIGWDLDRKVSTTVTSMKELLGSVGSKVTWILFLLQMTKK